MLPALLILTPLLFSPAAAEEFSASFKGTDIQEFINTVSKNLNKTVIIDPSVRGTITVRSYDMLNEEQYYQFFLSVLDVYGFAVINMNNGVLKVVRAKDAKTSAVPVASAAAPGEGDEVVTRVVPLTNVAARDLAPLLRQLNDNAGAGSVVHYEPSNVLLMTGRAAVIKRLLTIVERVDNAGDRSVVTVPLSWASAAEVVKLVTELNKDSSKSALPGSMVANVVADERTNAVLVSGEPNSRQRIIAMIKQLDRQQAVQGNTKVIYLKYAKAADLVEVLTGISSSLQNDKQSAKPVAAIDKNIIIKAHGQTNALIVTAAPDVMNDLERVIAQLDIRRPQVLVEAIIAGGGMVGGLGERYTRVAAAHAVHNGLTVLPQTDKFLHGTKVAYGILVQSALLGQDDVLAQLVQAYQHFNLPTTLAALEVDINNRAELDRVIAHTLRPGESIHYLPVTLTPEVLRAAFEKVEYFSR